MIWKNSRIYTGLIIWIITTVWMYNLFTQNYQALSPKQKEALSDLKNYYLHAPKEIDIFFEHWVWIAPGDQVITRDEKGELSLLGRVFSMGPKETGYLCRVKFFQPADLEKLTQETKFFYVQTKTSAVWILNTLVPNEKKKGVLAVFDRFLEHNRGYLSEILLPLLKDMAKETYAAIETDFPEVWKSNQERLNTLFEKHKITTLENELIPMMKNHLWPLIQKESAPVIESIGQELWGEFPKWGIAWRSAYEKIPGTDNDHVVLHWKQYLQDKALPILEKRTPDMLKTLKTILLKAAKDEKISSALKTGIQEIASDLEFIQVLKDIFRDLILNNKTLKTRLSKRLSEPEFQKQISFLSSRFEPYVNEISNLLLLDENLEGISPNLARVLRTQILHKDTHFIYVEFSKESQKVDGDHLFSGTERKDPFMNDSNQIKK
ncbi:MAG: hypothetical protein AABZ60_13985 [Planctomycetota bacterium]